MTNLKNQKKPVKERLDDAIQEMVQGLYIIGIEREQKSIVSDLNRIDKMKGEDIDYSDIPALDDSFFKKSVVTLPHKKTSITLRLDYEVLSFFKEQGKGYQTLINAVLKTYVVAQQKPKFSRSKTE